MKSLIGAALLALSLAPTVAAQTRDALVVPVEEAPYHVPVFRNELVTVLNVYIPPQRTSGYHRHSLDSIGVLIADTDRTGQVLGVRIGSLNALLRGPRAARNEDCVKASV